ncbi:hypothetical protein [Dactylosporangium sp. CA-092794]|uniref:hypothetical protein n=1 Tax=Dactylosporangium sp. CA-092794 TaxID=3239929 RepID=UPI003D8A481D
MKTTRSKRLALAAAAILGAIGVSLLIPSIAMPALPNPPIAGITMGGLHLTPFSGDGSETPSFNTDHACPAGTTLANVNTIDTTGVEQTISGNATGVVPTLPGFAIPGNTDMNLVQFVAGTPGTDESFLFMVDCRTGAGHGTYTDAVQVDFAADGSWMVSGTQPGTPTPSASASSSHSPSASASASASPSASPSPSASASSSSPSPSAAESSSSPAPSESVSPSPSPTLPVTGSNVSALTGIALTMIAVGVGLRYGARRRGPQSRT